MAVRQRILNSTAPFSGLPQAKLKGPYQSCPTPDEGTEEVEVEQHKGMFMFPSFKPILDKLLTQGTAEQVGKGPLKNSSFIAQAECETQDSQEFSPSCYERSSYVASPNCFTSSSVSSEHNNVACPRTASVQEPNGSQTQLSPRKKPRKRQKRKEKKKEEKKEEKKRQRQRVPSGVPEQESGSSVVQLQEEVSNKSCRGGRRRSNGTSCCSSIGTSCCSSNGTSCCSSIGTSCCSSIESSEVQDTGPPLHHTQQICCQGPGGRAALACWGSTAAVLGPFSDLTARGRDSDTEESSSACSSVGDYTLALAGLRGSVSQGDPCYAGPFFRDVERDAREEEEELSASSSFVNEGLFFYNENFQPVDSEYREGREYFVSRFIKQGAYGEVHSGQDVNTGFRFAAKKIHLKRFSSEEVGAWSTLRSPRVVELFGAVREGPYVVLFMDHKHGSVGQLIVERGRLPEDLALHYHWQVLAALLYLLKKRVVHLDIKADNVLLSEDGKDTFLCDFGHSERLDNHGQSLSGCRDLKGTETHMAPEIVKALPRGAKADVWSSCCLLLHMLNGCQPWTRYYACRLSLYLKIANEPPPLREIPSDCSDLTAEVIRAGLQKDPVKRASASDLKEKTARALKEVGGLASPVRGGAYVEPLRLVDKPPDSPQPSGVSFEEEEEEEEQRTQDGGRSSYEPDNGDDDDDEEEEEEEMKADTEKKTDHGSPLRLQTRCHDEPNNKTANVITTVSELELRKLERDFYLSSLSQLHSAEIQEQLLSCLSSDCYSNWEPWDKKDSGRWSLSPGDDLSSGVFSYNSQPEGQVLSMDWLTHTQLAPPCCFEGVDVCIRDFNRRSIRIRETRRVKVGHIATGISDQISERVFTLETQEGQQVAHDEEVQDSGLELCCVSAPDCSPSWRWRIRDGLLETR